MVKKVLCTKSYDSQNNAHACKFSMRHSFTARKFFSANNFRLSTECVRKLTVHMLQSKPLAAFLRSAHSIRILNNSVDAFGTQTSHRGVCWRCGLTLGGCVGRVEPAVFRYLSRGTCNSSKGAGCSKSWELGGRSIIIIRSTISINRDFPVISSFPSYLNSQDMRFTRSEGSVVCWPFV